MLKWTITGEPFAHCIAPGATVKFDWEGPFHNVEKVDKEEREGRVNFFIVTVAFCYFFLLLTYYNRYSIYSH